MIWVCHINRLPGELQLHLSFMYGKKIAISWPVVLPNIHVITVVSNHHLFAGCSNFFAPNITDMILNYSNRHCELNTLQNLSKAHCFSPQIQLKCKQMLTVYKTPSIQFIRNKQTIKFPTINNTCHSPCTIVIKWKHVFFTSLKLKITSPKTATTENIEYCDKRSHI